MADLVRPERGATLSQQVADQLRANIVTGDWPVGTKIPPEPELVRLLGVSRSTIREAVRSLAHVRMLETRAGDGTYVCSDSALGFPILDRLARADRREVLEVQKMFELYTARVAAQHCTPPQTRQLRDLLSVTETAAAQALSIADLMPSSLEVYRMMSKIAGNELLAELYTHLSTPPAADITLPLDRAIATRWQRLLEELVDAISHNEPDCAADTVEQFHALIEPLMTSGG
ncbi:FadR/GntR family transcriptional regulator [Nocardia colli]|uniref:FadR/GntR family transcriptional regulator n=1 Tax=Nocardia colli TaxID=2545717 RepID=UPI0035E1B759